MLIFCGKFNLGSLTMKSFNSIVKDIKNNQIDPVYFLHGEEIFYINKISKLIQSQILKEQDKAFNQFILYPNEITDYREVILLCREFPIGTANKKIIIMKEAQNYSNFVWKLFEEYFSNIQPTTILVIEYKYKKLDKSKNIYKILNKNQWIFESKKLYDYQLPSWILNQCKKNNLKIDKESIWILIKYLGNDLSQIYNELKKMSLFNIKDVTVDFIKKQIVMNKRYSIFDFITALGNRNLVESFQIVNFFLKNEKKFPIIKTNYQIFYFFVQLMLVHTTNDKSKMSISKLLKINEFFVNIFLNASLNYQLKEIIKIINIIYQYDLQLKGISKTISLSSEELFKEMIYKILIFRL